MAVPVDRIRHLNARAIREGGRFVLYWMTSARRLEYNFGLQRAADFCRELHAPLVILEALRCDYPFASERLHQFILDGMSEHDRSLAGSQVRYLPYVEPSAHAGKGLVAALAADAAVVVTDWHPAFILPRMVTAAARQVGVRMEAVDSNGLIPITDPGRPLTSARAMRAHVQRTFRRHVRDFPVPHPLTELPDVEPALLEPAIQHRWPAATEDVLNGATLSSLPIDHGVAPTATRGGALPARKRLRSFISRGLTRYADDHGEPAGDATSRLSPWLHFGHLSAHQVFAAIASHERWTTRKLGAGARGARDGWWNMSASAEAYLDELVTWRELAFNTCEFVEGYDRYDSLPAWARGTLDAHRSDPRPHVYTLATLEAAETHDPVWNAAQRQLRRDGWFHGYMRMLWGKKILEWSARPEEALRTMALLMNRYSLDGRDPNSWAGFGWILGRYDRPWPEREVFGTVRYMSSSNAVKKLNLAPYLRQYGQSGDLFA